MPTQPTTIDGGPTPLNYARFMMPHERDTLLSWRKLDKEVDEFVYCWTLWKNWERFPPIVIRMGRNLVGYHGVTFSEARGASLSYANSASQFVLPDYRGRKLAGAMVNFLLRQAHTKGCTRLRFRTPLEGPGYDTWRGFGVLPFATGKGNFWFDLTLNHPDGTHIATVAHLLKLGGELHHPPTTCKTRLSLYRRGNLTPTVAGSAYRDLLKPAAA